MASSLVIGFVTLAVIVGVFFQGDYSKASIYTVVSFLYSQWKKMTMLNTF